MKHRIEVAVYFRYKTVVKNQYNFAVKTIYLYLVPKITTIVTSNFLTSQNVYLLLEH